MQTIFGSKPHARPPSISTHFAMMTDLSRYSPTAPEHHSSPVPGVVMRLEQYLPNPDSQEKYSGCLLDSDSQPPTAVYAMTLGQHVFVELLNPLDPALRKAMEQHRDAMTFPQLIIGKGGNAKPRLPRMRHWDVALAETEGRGSVDPEIWLLSAQRIAEDLPDAYRTSGRFNSASHFHMYFVVPDDENHPLHWRVR
ncbi:hypothetical protein [Rhizobacter sp. Root404]|uniref:hypothetical protein n=1 Tax=Rhizobacter sp. Root404 TaxID=1736528 RepID=UPI0012FAD9FF|nr:hypothetical protein [Rhizobacter sp. Root404]